MEKQRNSTSRTPWGVGRVQFRANLLTIKDLLDAGWPMSIVYHQVKGSLAGVSYRQFTNYVRKHLNSVRKPSKKNHEAIKRLIESTERASAAESLKAKGFANDEKSKTRGIPVKFQPGPIVPDPGQLY